MSARDDMRDWPSGLRLNVAALELAPFLYYKVCEVYGGGALWDTLPFERQHVYVEAANEALRAFQPIKIANPGTPSTLRLVTK